MPLTITEILESKYGIKAHHRSNIECPSCHKMTFSIKGDNSMGKCFHPSCEKVLFADQGGAPPPKNHATVQPPGGCSLEDYAFTKNLSMDFLQSLNLTQQSIHGFPVVKIPYFDEKGTEAAVRFRKSLMKANGIDNRFSWKTGSKPLPYGLWKLQDAWKVGYICLVEGESDCHTLWNEKIPALGIPGANTWKEGWADFLKDIPVIYVVKEPDAGGDAVLKWLSKSKILDRAKIISLDPYKDPSELYLSDPAGFTRNWQAALDRARPWVEIKSSTDQTIAQEAWEKCEPIALNPSILNLLISDLRRMGLVGEERNAKILFLALVSRFLSRPVSISIKGPSSCGKSYVIEQVLKFFPERAFYRLTAMSERALIYSEEQLSERFLIISEASGIEGDILSYLIRSLLSEGQLRYETVENTPKGLKPRLIQRDGPTGLIITTTALNLHPENETRILSLPILDTREQTRDVMLAISVDSRESIDFSRWHALQVWLEQSDNRVVIPYAKRVAELVPPVHVRLRRDFTQILNLIKAHAILHQANRRRNEKGEIIADIEDYQRVRELILEIVGDGIGMVVSKPVRETVACVKQILSQGQSEVKEKSISVHLNLDKSVIHRRVKKAISLGFLVNNETQKYRPARLILGDSLPEDTDILPPAEALDGCMVARENGGEYTPPPNEELKVETPVEEIASTQQERYPWTPILKD